jgi:hypothetical protein
MPENNIEIGKEGVRVSYLRLLSDSVSGFIVIVFGLTSYYFPTFGLPLQDFFGSSLPISTEFKIFFVVALFVSASPLGLAINAISWFLLGWLDSISQKRLWKYRQTFLLRPIFVREMEFSDAFFGINKSEDWFRKTAIIKQILEIYKPEVLDGLAYLRGLSILFRNLSFLFLVFPFASMIAALALNLNAWQKFNLRVSSIIILIFSIIIFYILSIFVAIHHESRIYNYAYILLVSKGKKANCADSEFIPMFSKLLNISS